jgi:hypothetical protein
MLNFMKIRSMEAEFLYVEEGTDGQTDRRT